MQQLNNMITKHAKKVATITAVSAILSGGMFGSSLWYVSSQGALLTERAQAVADHTTQAKTYQGLERLLDDSTNERQQLHEFILTEAATIDFLADIERVAAQSGVTITTDTLTVAEAKSFNTLTVQFSIEGEAGPVAAMIQILETLPYKSYVDSLSLTTRSSATPPVTAVVRLAVSLANI